MSISSARGLILLYGLLTASAYPYIAVADDVSVEVNGVLAGLVIWGLIVRGLWKGSSFAWGVAAFLDVLTILSLLLMAASGLSAYVLLGLAFVHLAILFSPSVWAHMRARDDARLASS